MWWAVFYRRSITGNWEIVYLGPHEEKATECEDDFYSGEYGEVFSECYLTQVGGN